MSFEEKADIPIVGVLSDTHGPVSTPVLRALEGSHTILHAGDIVDEGVVDSLSRIAPVVAVSGNMDGPCIAGRFPKTHMTEVVGIWFYLLHDLSRLDIEPAAAGVGVVVHGHTHRADIARRGGVLYLNPGSARGAHATVAKIAVEKGEIRPSIIEVNPSFTTDFRRHR